METRLIKMTVEQWLKKWKIEACTLKLVIAEKKINLKKKKICFII